MPRPPPMGFPTIGLDDIPLKGSMDDCMREEPALDKIGLVDGEGGKPLEAPTVGCKVLKPKGSAANCRLKKIVNMSPAKQVGSLKLTGSACDEDLAAGAGAGAELIPNKSSSKAGAGAATGADLTGTEGFVAGISSKSSKPSSTTGAGTGAGFGLGGSSLRGLGGRAGAGAGTAVEVGEAEEATGFERGSKIRETFKITALLLAGMVSESLLRSNQILRWPICFKTRN